MIWMLPLLGAAAGALMDKKKPLRGAMLGGLAGMTGGAAAGAGGLLGGAASAGAAGAGAAGAGAGGLLGGAGASGAAGAGAGNAMSVGGFLKTAQNIAEPVFGAVQAAQSMTPQEQPIQAMEPAQLPDGKMDLTGLLQNSQQQRTAEEEEAFRRRQMMNKYTGQIGRMG